MPRKSANVTHFELSPLLEFCDPKNGNCMPTFRDDPLVPSSSALNFYALEDGADIVPKRRHGITILRCVMLQKGADLKYRVYTKEWCGFKS